LANELDSDPEIRTAMADVAINEKPSSYVERELGRSLEDEALTVIQGLVGSMDMTIPARFGRSL